MKANKYIEMTDTELDQQLAELKTELFNLRFQLATGQLQNPMMIRETKRNIARVKTILRDRQIKAIRKGETSMSEVRGNRKTRVGIVVSDKMDKTIVVAIKTRVKHGLYGKILNRTTKLNAHGENNTCSVGDVGKVMETRPWSREKRWRLVEIVEKAK